MYPLRDVLDRLTDVYGPGANVILDTSNHIQISYDALGRKTSMTDPDMGTWTYDYDAAGNLTRQTDARQKTLCFEYDALNRLNYVREDQSVPPDHDCQSGLVWRASYYWDHLPSQNPPANGIGRRIQMDDLSGSTAWEYDARGRVTKETKSISGGGTFVTQWQYDALDRVQTMTYPDNEVVSYTYNSQGLIESVAGSSTYVESTDYDSLGRVELRKLGNDVVRQDPVYYAWSQANGQGRLKQVKAGTPSDSTSLQDLRYSYDAAGNVLSIQDWKAGAPQTQSFSYDELDRLVAAVTSGGSSGSYNESYSYDKAGSLTSKTGVGSYAYGASANGCQSGTPASKPHAVTTAGTYSFSYDCNGNITNRLAAGRAYTLTYDAENRLASVSGAASASFEYDGDGHRVKATFGGTTTLYVGDYYEKTGSVIKKYYYANGQRVAMRDGGTVYFLLPDHLGSTAVTADGSGDRTAELWYKPWGENRNAYGTTPTSYRFTGQREDATIALYFYHARYYDPMLGRFISPDTIVPSPGDPQSLNRYAYTRNNPVRYTDPSGHFECIDTDCTLG